ncbi:YetF domain-containing protein [Paucimonas lemoignei]|uniref:YetF domain-containing protein n=1 Tax=Paucimonas lemoignei TaxID=29443 RepID=UPI0010476B3D
MHQSLCTIPSFTLRENWQGFDHLSVDPDLHACNPLQVVRNGRLMRRNMRRAYLTEEELLSQLRRQGIERIEDVKAAYIFTHLC